MINYESSYESTSCVNGVCTMERGVKLNDKWYKYVECDGKVIHSDIPKLEKLLAKNEVPKFTKQADVIETRIEQYLDKQNELKAEITALNSREYSVERCKEVKARLKKIDEQMLVNANILAELKKIRSVL